MPTLGVVQLGAPVLTEPTLEPNPGHQEPSNPPVGSAGSRLCRFPVRGYFVELSGWMRGRPTTRGGCAAGAVFGRAADELDAGGRLGNLTPELPLGWERPFQAAWSPRNHAPPKAKPPDTYEYPPPQPQHRKRDLKSSFTEGVLDRLDGFKNAGADTATRARRQDTMSKPDGLDPSTLYAVDLSGPLTVLPGMRAWADDRSEMPAVVFISSHRVETFATAGGAGPDPFLLALATHWAKFDDFPAWETPATGWKAVLDAAADDFTVTGPDGVLFYSGPLGSSKKWRRTAREQRVFLALAGAITTPADIADATDRGQMYALFCPVTLAAP